jgi:hypothetical protein
VGVIFLVEVATYAGVTHVGQAGNNHFYLFGDWLGNHNLEEANIPVVDIDAYKSLDDT